MARVLVTRPEPGASATANRLRAMGHDPVVVPLSRTETLHASFPPADAVQAVAVSSAASLHHAGMALQPFTRLPCFAVGERTGRAASAAGFGDVRVAQGDAAALARILVEALPPGAAILYPCGRVRRPELETALAKAGIRAEVVEVYDTVALTPTPDQLRQISAGAEPEMVLLYSPNAAAALAGLLSGGVMQALPETTRFLCLSHAVARPLAGRVAGRIDVAQRPDEDALLALLAAG